VAEVRVVDAVSNNGHPRCAARLEARATDVADDSGANTTVGDVDFFAELIVAATGSSAAVSTARQIHLLGRLSCPAR